MRPPPVTHTSRTTRTSRWGLTTSTAEDRTRLATALLHGGGPLAAPHREEAWRTMTAVHPTQQWGLSAGVPSGWTVASHPAIGSSGPVGKPGWRSMPCPSSAGTAASPPSTTLACTVVTSTVGCPAGPVAR